MKRKFKTAVLKVLDLLRLTERAGYVSSWLKYMKDPTLRARNAAIRKDGPPDGLPMPPLKMTFLVSSTFDLDYFYKKGVLGAGCIRHILKKNGYDIGSFGAVLDFGCGCGRVMRHWSRLSGPRLFGTDYNPYLVGWCRKSLTFAEFRVNGLGTGLDFYEDDKFDFIYSISVFTHLDEGLQGFWMGELWRVLKPGGLLLVTLHGESRADELSPAERGRFDSGSLVVIKGSFSGSNVCSVYHPDRYVRETLAKGFSVIDFIPGGAKDAVQDQYLLKKHPAG